MPFQPHEYRGIRDIPSCSSDVLRSVLLSKLNLRSPHNLSSFDVVCLSSQQLPLSTFETSWFRLPISPLVILK